MGINLKLLIPRVLITPSYFYKKYCEKFINKKFSRFIFRITLKIEHLDFFKIKTIYFMYMVFYYFPYYS